MVNVLWRKRKPGGGAADQRVRVGGMCSVEGCAQTRKVSLRKKPPSTDQHDAGRGISPEICRVSAQG